MSHTTTNVGGSKTGWATLKLTNSVERREAQKFNIQKSEAQKATQLHEQESIKKVGALECTTTPVLKGRMWASVGEDGAGKTPVAPSSKLVLGEAMFPTLVGSKPKDRMSGKLSSIRRTTIPVQSSTTNASSKWFEKSFSSPSPASSTVSANTSSLISSQSDGAPPILTRKVKKNKFAFEDTLDSPDCVPKNEW